MSLVVRSGDGQRKTVDCPTVTVKRTTTDYNNLQFTCRVSNTNAIIDEKIIYSAIVSGGDGDYTYSWSGSESNSGRRSALTAQYQRTGTKTMTLTVKSGDGQRKTLDCPTVVVRQYTTTPSYPQNPSNNVNVSGVYLNQVPYTGLADNPMVWGFAGLIVLMSGVGAYMIIQHRNRKERSNAIEEFKQANMRRLITK